MKNKTILKFGVPSLDRLLHHATPEQGEFGSLQRSACIIGPTGTGKSILAMHLAAEYRRQTRHKAKKPTAVCVCPRVLYVSTDLNYETASRIWREFGMNADLNARRTTPFLEQSDLLTAGETKLNRYRADELDGQDRLSKFITDYECQKNPTTAEAQEVAFVDLADTTAGDDWGLITRILAMLPIPPIHGAKHMMVIDAVEGLEMLTSEADAFGEKRSRRARIAQILRAAAEKCNILFVLEATETKTHQAEEYVTDLVLQLRAGMEGSYLRRTLEIVKFRGKPHARGEHDYFIRKRKDDDNGHLPDDPAGVGFAYFHVVPSLQQLSREWTRDLDENSLDIRKKECAFTDGIAAIESPDFEGILPVYIVEQSPGTQEREDQDKPKEYYGGFYRGKVTSLIGDEATLKSRLGHAFLAGAFSNKLHKSIGQLDKPAAALLLTTRNIDEGELARIIQVHIETTEKFFAVATSFGPNAPFADLLLCRQLEVHHLNGSTLFHIIRRSVESALKAIERWQRLSARRRHSILNSLTAPGRGDSLKDPTYSDSPEENQRSWHGFSKFAPRLRVVIDDWSVIEAAYPEVRADPLFLSFLIKYFQRVGVTALIIATQPGRPDEILKGVSEQPLRALSDYHLYTWHVPFFGTDRVAITAMPRMNENQSAMVAELRVPTHDEAATIARSEGREDSAVESIRRERLVIDTHFDLYKDIDTDHPQMAPLEVTLYAGGNSTFESHIAELNTLLGRLFRARTDGKVIVAENLALYARMRDYSRLQGSMRDNYTLVMQVDEYWKPPQEGPSGNSGRQRRTPYLLQSSHENGAANPNYDPLKAYQPVISDPKHGRAEKHQFFDCELFVRCDQKEVKDVSKRARSKKIYQTSVIVAESMEDTAPFLWDFGFLLLRERAWTSPQKDACGRTIAPEEDRLVERVWNALSLPLPGKPGLNDKPVISWRDFLHASMIVSNRHNIPHREPMIPFDLDIRSPQSFACLVFEIWASELSKARRARFFPINRKYEKAMPLKEMLKSREGREALFMAWLLIAEVLDSRNFVSDMHELIPRPAMGKAVAERHWYSTGSLAWRDAGMENPLTPARLPGTRSTRGDWFLRVGDGSLSRRLGERAIDILCRRKLNLERLESGLGLPVRKLIRTDFDGYLLRDRQSHSKDYDCILTAIARVHPDGRRRLVRYHELMSLGASYSNDARLFQWLWRSQIVDYNRYDYMWEKWLGRLLVDACAYMRDLRTSVTSTPFAAYDFFKEHDNASDNSVLGRRLANAWRKFSSRCDCLIKELDSFGPT